MYIPTDFFLNDKAPVSILVRASLLISLCPGSSVISKVTLAKLHNPSKLHQ